MVLPAGSRVSVCGRRLAHGQTLAEVLYSAEAESARWRHVLLCGSVWTCPVCSDRVSAQRRADLREAIAAWRARGGSVVMVTFTFSHHLRQPLADTLGPFLAAHRAMHQRRAYRALRETYGLAGYVRSLEVTWGETNGWHPHLHVVYFVEGSLSDRSEAFRAAFYAAWSAAAASKGLSMTSEHGLVVSSAGVDVDAYVTKFGHEPAGRWDAADELTRAHSKRARSPSELWRYTPFDLLREWLETKGERMAELFREFADVFAGRTQLYWSPGFRAELGLDDPVPDELVPDAAPSDETVVLRFDRYEFNVIVRYDAQDVVLGLVETAGPAVARQYVDGLVARSYVDGPGDPDG
jgi:hypothetical protein